MGDLLRLPRSPAPAIPPPGVADLADDPVLDRGPVHRSPGEAHGGAGELDDLAQLELPLGDGQLDLELGPLVFLDSDLRLPGRIHGLDRHGPGQPVGGRGEGPADRAESVADQAQGRGFLLVGVAQDHPHRLSGQDAIVAGGLVDRQAKALEVDRLAGPVDGPVGEEDRPGGRPLAGLASPLHLGLGQLGAVRSLDVVDAAAVGIGDIQSYGALGVGAGGGGPQERALVVVPLVDGHFGSGHGLARVGLDDQAFGGRSGRSLDDAQSGYPEGRRLDLVPLLGESGIIAGQKPVVARLESGQLDQGPAGLVVYGRLQVGRPGRFGLALQYLGHGGAARPKQLLGTLAFQERGEILAHGAEMEPGHIAVFGDQRGRLSREDGRLGPDVEFAGSDAGDQHPAVGRASGLGVSLGPLPGQGQRPDGVAPRLHLTGPAGQDGGLQLRRPVGLGQLAQALDVGPAGGVAGRRADVVQPVQVDVQRHVAVSVVAVEGQQVLIQAQGPQSRRLRVRRLGLVLEERGGRGQGIGVGGDLEGVLGPGRGLFARSIEAQRLEGGEVEERRPKMGRLLAGLQEAVKGGDRRPLESVGLLEDILVKAIDGPQKTGQVPGGEVLVVHPIGGLPAHEAPAVAGEVAPVPAGLDELEHRPQGGGSLVDLLPQAGQARSGLVAFDGPFQDELAGQGPQGLGRLILRGGREVDAPQQADGRLGQAVGLGFGRLGP